MCGVFILAPIDLVLVDEPEIEATGARPPG
jgi:hypothetical protein